MNCFDWSLFWSATSAIGTVFVGFVAVGITIWQTHLQYRSKAKINVCLTTLIPWETDSDKFETPIAVTVTNMGNSPMLITHFCLCYKDKKSKKEKLILENPLNQSKIHKMLGAKTPCELNSKGQVVFAFCEVDELEKSKGKDLKFRARVIDSLNKRFYSKEFSLNSLEKAMTTLDFSV